MRLEDLTRVFGGTIRTVGKRTWLDTKVGGLRTFVVRRVTEDHGVTFDLAVFTPHTRELDPFFAREEGLEWALGDDRAVPRLESPFIFAGCRRGILFARNTGEPSLESMVTTLWTLAGWARKPWRPTRERFPTEELNKLVRERWRSWVLAIVIIALIIFATC